MCRQDLQSFQQSIETAASASHLVLRSQSNGIVQFLICKQEYNLMTGSIDRLFSLCSLFYPMIASCTGGG
jgi:hypothetical protein